MLPTQRFRKVLAPHLPTKWFHTILLGRNTSSVALSNVYNVYGREWSSADAPSKRSMGERGKQVVRWLGQVLRYHQTYNQAVHTAKLVAPDAQAKEHPCHRMQ